MGTSIPSDAGGALALQRARGLPSGVGRHRRHFVDPGAAIWSGDLRGLQRRTPDWVPPRGVPYVIFARRRSRDRRCGGVTSRVILEAMSINGTGHLWSLDLPHPFRPELHKETAAAVPTACRDRWTYVRGSSRRRLASLVSTLTEIDMFVHDSLHTSRNIRFELRTVWPALQRGDLVLVDDVDNQAFRDFVREVGNPPSIVLRSADGPCLFGAIQKEGVASHGRDPSTATVSPGDALEANLALE